MSPQDASKFTVLPATPADAEVLLKIIDLAFADDFFRQAAMPKSREHLTPLDELRSWRLRNLRKRISAPDKVLLKAVLAAQPDRMVGFADLQKPPPLRDDAEKSAAPTTQPDSKATQADSTAETGDPHTLPACFDPALNDGMNDRLESWQLKIWGDDEQYWSLEKLGVDPAFRRQGVAKLLLEECLKLADADALPMYLEALPGSAEMYLEYGFESRGSFTILDGNYVVKLMVRRPQKLLS
ncbi:hypothetical protein LTR95_011635 [Oleoguttula sp. CCFEE 5521]